jgi:DNA-binding response OmpR family regulator
VDDEEDMCGLLSEELVEAGFDVDTATGGEQALSMIGARRYTLVLADINMPHMSGFELVRRIRQQYAGLKTALITAYDVDDYIQMALEYNVGNIIPKPVPFRSDEVLETLRRIIREDFFGLTQYLDPHTAVSTVRVRRADEIGSTAAAVSNALGEHEEDGRIRLVLAEALMNAFFYGALNEDPDERDSWSYDATLADDKAIEVQYGRDREKTGISVVDTAGRLTKQEVLYWLDRQTPRRNTGERPGLLDMHGRGLMICRHYVDRLIVNIRRGRCTEVIALDHGRCGPASRRPLCINEV